VKKKVRLSVLLLGFELELS
jgi:hypothetical protein